MSSFLTKKPSKNEREKQVLLGLVELYLKTGKPVGSQTLKESGFDSLSPATLRNYFAKLEETGFLKQQHSSGGRIPTHLAYKTYAEAVWETATLEEKEKKELTEFLFRETREVQLHLQQAAEILSSWSQSAVFLSTPRFDQDFILDSKIVSLDAHRILCVFLTDFGLVQSEVLLIDKKLSAFALKRIEQFFHWKLTGLDKPVLQEEEEKIATHLYNEAMLRHIVTNASFSSNDIIKTGFSKMLSYADFNDATSLAKGLSLFENDQSLKKLLVDCSESGHVKFWIGEDLEPISAAASSCAVLSIPYYIHQTAVGSLALLCPARAPYKKLFALLKTASEALSQSLTKSLYKFKISYRQPQSTQLDFNRQTALLSQQESDVLLENTQKN